MELILYTDGGSRGNPGPAAWGFVIYQDRKMIAERSGYLGITTNNVAEYTACIEGLQYILTTWGTDQVVSCLADSKLMVEQVKGNYKIKAPHLKPLITSIRQLCEQQKSVHFGHIPRERNHEADRMVNQELDRH
ncbi:ribonuclease HI family protein [Candidatus Gracilibacteria bacterium]|nr:ribonuclease HI family protein [Candidatus Gracilibacteria bacterium]